MTLRRLLLVAVITVTCTDALSQTGQDTVTGLTSCTPGGGSCIDSLSSSSISNGAVVTANGQDFWQETRAGWPSGVTDIRASFEGTSASSDGYQLAGSEPLYDTTTKLLGAKSMYTQISDSTISGSCPGDNQFGNYINNANHVPFSGTEGDYYVRFAGRWHLTGQHPYYAKFFELWEGVLYFQPNSDPSDGNPVLFAVDWNGFTKNVDADIAPPSGRFTYDRWYLIEVHFKNSNPTAVDIWIDGYLAFTKNSSQLGVWTYPTPGGWKNFNLMGIINGCWVTGSASNTLGAWMDAYGASTQRVYNPSEVWLCPTSTFDDTACVWQSPESISDTGVSFTVRRTGNTAKATGVTISTGTRYVFIRNNKRQVSTGFPVRVTQ